MAAPTPHPTSVFISYSRSDSTIIDRLEAELISYGFRTWVDRGHLEGGDKWVAQIERAIQASDVVIASLSPEAIASPWVSKELFYAQQLGKPIVPVLLRQVERIPMLLVELQYIDMQADESQGLRQLRMRLMRFGGQPSNAPKWNQDPPGPEAPRVNPEFPNLWPMEPNADREPPKQSPAISKRDSGWDDWEDGGRGDVSNVPKRYPRRSPRIPRRPTPEPSRQQGAQPSTQDSDQANLWPPLSRLPHGLDELPNAVAKPRLVVNIGKEPGHNYEIHKDRMTIGRARDSDIFVEDLSVSRLHATINLQSDGRYLLRDENSANGTMVNGQRVGDHMLEDGDKIQVGQTLLVFVYR